ncbi:MAG: hypothetical protein H7Y01_01285 [Ferruginibacter sp.]|nr:hypothetical protein [Chitinophagaceae bacterium]
MKRLVSLCFLFSWLHTAAQDSAAYTDLLKSADEVELSDSIHINAEQLQKNLLDSVTVKKWFSRVLGSGTNNRLKNRSYYLTGKITSNGTFDLLVLLEEKKRNDSSGVQVVYLISTKKNGTYIASIEAAVAGTRKRSSYNTSSWLYKNYKIVLDSRMTVNQKSYDDLTSYTINGGGRFILSPKYE